MPLPYVQRMLVFVTSPVPPNCSATSPPLLSMVAHALSHSAGPMTPVWLPQPLSIRSTRRVIGTLDFTSSSEILPSLFLSADAMSENGIGSPSASQTKTRSCQTIGTEIGAFVTPLIHHRRLPVAGL